MFCVSAVGTDWHWRCWRVDTMHRDVFVSSRQQHSILLRMADGRPFGKDK
jgi:hypothetical protein